MSTWLAEAATYPAVAALEGGGYVVVWQTAGGQDGAGKGIFARTFAAAP